MKTSRFSLFLVLLCVTQAVLARQSADLDVAWDELEAFWRTTMEETGVVGSSLMLLDEGSIVRSAFFGHADLDTGRRTDENTIYHWASNTKTFTGIAIMQLRDQGLLTLDDRVVDYIPELKQVHNPFGEMSDIRIHHLLSHSAGFRGSTWPWSGEDWHPHEPTRWDQLAAMMPYTEILFEPGSRYSYSNPGVVFLGRIIELLTGDDYEVYVDKNILKPLGMFRSYFDHTPRHLLQFRSNNYEVTDGTAIADGLDFDTGITVSNGGLNAPLTDMARYLAFLTGSGENRAVYDAILGRKSLEEMWEVQQPISSDDDEKWSLGLAFFIRQSSGPFIVGHTGSQKAFRTFIYFQPETGAACIAAFNSTVFKRVDSGDLRPEDIGFGAIRTRFFEQIFPLLN